MTNDSKPWDESDWDDAINEAQDKAGRHPDAVHDRVHPIALAWMEAKISNDDLLNNVSTGVLVATSCMVTRAVNDTFDLDPDAMRQAMAEYGDGWDENVMITDDLCSLKARMRSMFMLGYLLHAAEQSGEVDLGSSS